MISYGGSNAVNGGTKTVSHNSKNVSLGSNNNFMINDAVSATTVRPASVRD